MTLERKNGPNDKGLLQQLYEHDHFTYIHTLAVASKTDDFAVVLGLDPSDQAVLASAALYHDIGKRAVPVEILTKPADLTEEERAIINKHPARGALIYLESLQSAGLELAETDILTASLILHHHPTYGERRNSPPDSLENQAEERRANDLFYPVKHPEVRLLTPILRLVDTLCASSERRPENLPDPPAETKRKLLEDARVCGEVFGYDNDFLKALALGLFVLEVEPNEADIAEIQTISQSLPDLAPAEKQILANLAKATELLHHV